MQARTLKDRCARIAVLKGTTSTLNPVSVVEQNYKLIFENVFVPDVSLAFPEKTVLLIKVGVFQIIGKQEKSSQI